MSVTAIKEPEMHFKRGFSTILQFCNFAILQSHEKPLCISKKSSILQIHSVIWFVSSRVTKCQPWMRNIYFRDKEFKKIFVDVSLTSFLYPMTIMSTLPCMSVNNKRAKCVQWKFHFTQCIYCIDFWHRVVNFNSNGNIWENMHKCGKFYKFQLIFHVFQNSNEIFLCLCLRKWPRGILRKTLGQVDVYLHEDKSRPGTETTFARALLITGKLAEFKEAEKLTNFLKIAIFLK